MSVFIDTSAIFALIDSADEFNTEAERIFRNITGSDEKLLTSNYVILETIFLLQKFFGVTAVNDFKKKMLPMLGIIWVDESIHESALNSLIASQRKKVSLTDYCSFYILDNYKIDKVFTFDGYFEEKGYEILQ
jgi:uncharacterized protein